MNQTDILIVGGGITGLSAGCHGQASGFSTTILEQHSVPGGLCTAWKRRGYTFDYCIHWLVGSGKTSDFRRLWDFLDLAPADRIVNHEIFQSRTCSDGTVVHWYTNADQLEAHLGSLCTHPKDRILLKKFTNWIRTMATFQLMEPEASLRVLGLVLASLPALWTMLKVRGRLWADFAGQFRTPVLKEAMTTFFGMEGFPLLAVVFTLGFQHGKNAGYPLGGSLPMAKRVEARYRSLGGTIEYEKKVTEILVDRGRAVGVRCTDGSVYNARWVISAADAHRTIYGLLGNHFPSPEWDRAFAELKPFPGPVQASFGLRLDEPHPTRPGRFLLGRRLDDAAPTFTVNLKTPVKFEAHEVTAVGFHHYAFDPEMGPPHGTPVTFLFGGTTAWWEELAQDRDAYKAEKQRFLDDLVAAVDEVMPGFAERIEVRDLATPTTNIRYTDNWRGSQEGFMMGTPLPLPSTLPGLQGFRMVGQWRQPGGGVPPAASEGRQVIRELCRIEKRNFGKI